MFEFDSPHLKRAEKNETQTSNLKKKKTQQLS